MFDFIDRITKDSKIIKSNNLSRKDRLLLNDAVKEEYALKLKNGLYCPYSYVYELGYDFKDIVPGGVLCMFCAWYYYDMIDLIPKDIDIAVPAGTKITVPKYPSYKLHYRTYDHYSLGITTCKYNDEIMFNVYDVEKCVCDAIKFRNKIGFDIMEEVINSYLKRNDKDFDKLYKYADFMNIRKVLEKYLL